MQGELTILHGIQEAQECMAAMSQPGVAEVGSLDDGTAQGARQDSAAWRGVQREPRWTTSPVSA
jgi:hypothetical protein